VPRPQACTLLALLNRKPEGSTTRNLTPHHTCRSSPSRTAWGRPALRAWQRLFGSPAQCRQSRQWRACVPPADFGVLRCGQDRRS